jgi:hypothetical protein
MRFMTQLQDAQVAARFAEFQVTTIVPSSSAASAKTKTEATGLVSSIRGSVRGIFGAILNIISIWGIKAH